MNFSSDVIWSKQPVTGALLAPGDNNTTNFGAARRKYQDYLVARVLFIVILTLVTYILHMAFRYCLFLFET